MNRAIIIGRLTRDVELRRTANGTAVSSFTVAVNRTFQSNDGVTADFIQCKCFNKLAENVERYVQKGSQVAVDGRVQTGSYTNNQNQKIFTTEIICENVQFLDSKSSNSNTPKQEDKSSDPFFATVNPFDITDDDVQF